MSSKLRIGFLLALFVVATVAASWYVAGRTARAEAEAAVARFTAAFDDALAQQEGALAQLSRRFETVDDLKTAQELRLRRHRNPDHLRAARALGVRVADSTEVERLVAQRRLTPLADTLFYHVQRLDHSVAYVTPEAARLLRLLGERFEAALRARRLPRSRYVISSGLRTAAHQRALRPINPNAAAGTSSHEFGTTVDVVYHTYVYLPQAEDRLPPTPYPFLDERLETLRVRAYDALGMRYWQELQGLLGRVLIDLQEEGKVLVTLEREQPVFHLTVAERLP